MRGEHQGAALAALGRQGAAAGEGLAGLDAPVDAPRRPGVQPGAEPLGPRLQGGEVLPQHGEGGDRLQGLIRVAVEPQGGLERGQAHLVQPHRAQQRVAAERIKHGGAADQQPGLGPAHQLVAAERHQVRAGRQALLNRGLVGQAQPGDVEQGAAAEVVHQDQVALARQGGQFRQAGLAGEAQHAVVAGVHLEQHAGGGRDGSGIVGQPGLIGGPHLHQPCAALGDHVGDAEAAADLHQLAARDDHLAAAGQGAERQQHCGGGVVHRQGGLGAGNLAQQRFDALGARPAPPRRQVELQVGIARRHFGRRVRRRPGHGCAAEIGVQHHARGVDDPVQPRLGRGLEPLGHLRRQGRRVGDRPRSAAPQRRPAGLQAGAGGGQDLGAAVPDLQGPGVGMLDQAFHLRQGAQARIQGVVQDRASRERARYIGERRARQRTPVLADLPTPAPYRLTELAHGGGCGCKLAPSVLREILAGTPAAGPFAALMVGTETSDDAAVWRLNDAQALIATTDFFMPVVDDPYVFGQIAATNALSDVYAMGGRPILALAIVGMPVERIRIQDVQQILAGGASTCARAGIPIAGGHSIDSAEPIYGLVALGLVHPDKVRRNSDAQDGDVLILTKGLGVGVFSAALKQGRLDAEGYAAMVEATTRLNAVGAELAEVEAVHAMTDVTGFGLLGHLLEVCRGSALSAQIRWADTPHLPGALALAEAGVRTGASVRNWAAYGDAVRLPAQAPEAMRDLLCDPQTSGGLLVTVAADAAAGVLEQVRAAGFAQAAVIGRLAAGAATIEVV